MNGVRVRLLLLVLVAGVAGCGTSRWTDTRRSATEQMLLTDAIDRAVDRIDFGAIAGTDVYFDASHLKDTTDEFYTVSAIRQQLLAAGCGLKEKREQARYIVEARVGVVGTDRNDLTVGVPQVNVPAGLSAVGGLAAPVSSIPEIPFIKRTNQKGIAKVSMYAYERESGRAVWQSGAEPVVSAAKDVWIAGAGPFQQGSIYQETKFAGSRLPFPLNLMQRRPAPKKPLTINQPLVFESAAPRELNEIDRRATLVDHQQPDDDPMQNSGG